MWTKEEEDFILANPKKSYEELAEVLGRSISAVKSKKSRLGVRANNRGKRWTEDERRLLQNNYNKKSKEELMELLPERSWDSIRSQLRELKKKAEEKKWNLL